MNLLITSCQAANTFPLIEALAGYLARRLQIEVSYDQESPWQQRSARILTGQIQLGMICSRPYAEQLVASDRRLLGVAAPVTRGALYAGRPVYYSYLVVPRHHPANSLPDLQGAVVTYNEPGSQSGYFSLHWALSNIGASPAFFSTWVESGSHQQSLALLRAGKVAAAAIDSTLWDYLEYLDNGRFAWLKIIDTLGPFPAPPLVTHISTPSDLLARLTHILTTMHLDGEGQAVLNAGLLTRFDPVTDPLYRQLL
jgi:phosphonate transport system substrate-binding protein